MTPQQPSGPSYPQNGGQNGAIPIPVDGADLIQVSTVSSPMQSLQNADSWAVAITLGIGNAPPNAQPDATNAPGALQQQVRGTSKYQSSGITRVLAGQGSSPSSLATISGAPGDVIALGIPQGLYTYCVEAMVANFVGGGYGAAWPAADGVNVVYTSSITAYTNGMTASYGQNVSSSGNTYVCIVPGVCTSSSMTGTSVGLVITNGAAQFLYAGSGTNAPGAWINIGYFKQTAVGGAGYGYLLPQLGAGGVVDWTLMQQNVAASGSPLQLAVPTTPANFFAFKVFGTTPSGQQLVLDNGWTPSDNAGMFRDNSGIVHLVGTITGNNTVEYLLDPSTQQVFPAGYRIAGTGSRVLPIAGAWSSNNQLAVAQVNEHNINGNPPYPVEDPFPDNLLIQLPDSDLPIPAGGTVNLDSLSWLATA